MSKTLSKDMTIGNPFKILLIFAIPVLAGNVFQQLYSMVDTIIVGKCIGTDALAAVGATGSLNFLVNGFSIGITSGFAVLPAQFFGAKDERKLRQSVAQAIILCAFFVVLLTTVSVTCTHKVLVLMKTPDDIIGQSEIYIKTIFFGICVTMLYNMCACVLRALGDSKTPLYFLIVSSFMNIGLDLLFIVVFKWGVFGAAFATVLSQGIAGILCVIYAYKKYDILHLSKSDYTMNFVLIKNHLVIALPMAFQFSITAIGTVVLQGALNTFGSEKIAAYTAGCKVEQLVTQIGPALGVTMASYSGQNLGAGRIDRIKSGVRSCTILAVSLAVLSAVALYFAGESLSSLFITGEQSEVLEYSVLYINTIIVYFPALFMIFVYRNVLQGIGKSLMPFLAGVFELIARCVVSFTLPQRIGYKGVCIAGPVAWFAAMIPLCIAYYIIINRMSKKKAEKIEIIQ